MRVCLKEGNFFDEVYIGVYVKGYLFKKNIFLEKKKFCESMMKNEILYVKYFCENMIKWIKNIEEFDEYLDDLKNDWEVVGDLEYDFILLGEGIFFIDGVIIMVRLESIKGEFKNL